MSMVTGQNLLRLSALAALGLFAQGAAGAPLVSYNFGALGQETTDETSTAFAPTTMAPGVTATPVQDTSGKVGIEISSAATTPVGAPFNRVDPQANATTAALAVSNGVYYSFTVTPTGSMSLTDLQFDIARGGAGTPRGYEVRSSVGNFATTLSGGDVLTVRPAYTHVNVDLTGPAFQNLTTPTTFRFYVYSPAGGSSLDFDNIVLSGAAAVPEPASLGFVGLAAVGLMRRSRRRV
jgi:hypothetical protein